MTDRQIDRQMPVQLCISTTKFYNNNIKKRLVFHKIWQKWPCEKCGQFCGVCIRPRRRITFSDLIHNVHQSQPIKRTL